MPVACDKSSYRDVKISLIIIIPKERCHCAIKCGRQFVGKSNQFHAEVWFPCKYIKNIKHYINILFK